MKSKKIHDAKVSTLADCEGGGAVYQGQGGAGEGEEYGVGRGHLGAPVMHLLRDLQGS